MHCKQCGRAVKTVCNSVYCGNGNDWCEHRKNLQSHVTLLLTFSSNNTAVVVSIMPCSIQVILN